MTIEMPLEKEKTNIKKIAIIGAGGAGVISAAKLQEQGFDCTLFEIRNNVGGLWNYNDNSPVYKSLVTNHPKQVMAMSDCHPFKEDIPSFVTHKDMLQYVEDLWAQYSLEARTYLGTKVVKLEPQDRSAFSKWTLTYETLNTGEQATDIFDACLVCNGHYDIPVFAHIDGLQHFNGCQEHAKSYDTPEPYAGKNVIVIGSGSSGTDIAREVATTSKSVIVSSRKQQHNIEQYDNLHLRGGISHIDEAGQMHFVDGGSSVAADIIIHCTGYEYNFDFLDDSIISVENHNVKPLYKQIFSCTQPSLAFIGIPYDKLPFVMFKYQADYVVQIFSGNKTLPNQEERFKSLHEEEIFIKEFGFPASKKHCLSQGLIWDYFRDIVKLSGHDTQRELNLIRLYQEIRENMGAPPYTGGNDNYRRNNFEVDFTHFRWHKIVA